MTNEKGIHFLRRLPEGIEEDQPKPSFRPYLIGCAIGLALGLGVAAVLPFMPSRDRYQMMHLASGIVARMDRATGSLLFVDSTGAVLGEYPKSTDARSATFDPEKYLKSNP